MIYANKTKLKVAVIENGMTLKSLAEATGSHYQTIVKIASGKTSTTKPRALFIANKLNKNFDDIFEVKN